VPVFAFLTCGYDDGPATRLVGAIHTKAMPVVLHAADEERWLTAPINEALPLACAFPRQLMTVRDA
jgi:putative SOS response-associated peptidase YedK